MSRFVCQRAGWRRYLEYSITENLSTRFQFILMERAHTTVDLCFYTNVLKLTTLTHDAGVCSPTSTGSFSFCLCLGGFPGVVGGTFFGALLGVLLVVFVGPFPFQLFMISIVAEFVLPTANTVNRGFLQLGLGLNLFGFIQIDQSTLVIMTYFKPHPQEFTDRVPNMPYSKLCPKVNCG